MLRLIQGLSVAGDDANEDLCWIGTDDAVLLDGASSLDSKHHDSIDFVMAFIGEYKKVADGTDLPLHDCVNLALSPLRSQFDRERYASDVAPSASVAVARLRHGILSVLLIGDCTAIIYGTDGVARRLRLDEVKAFDRIALSLARSISERDGTSMCVAMQSDSVRRCLMANRMKMNADDGYRILAADMPLVGEKDVIHIPEDEVAAFLLHSDGFDAIGDRFLSPTCNIRRLYGELRAMEETDANFDEMPRFKLHDDASAMMVSVRS